MITKKILDLNKTLTTGLKVQVKKINDIYNTANTDNVVCHCQNIIRSWSELRMIMH